MTNRSRKILALALIVVGLFMVCVATVAQAQTTKKYFGATLLWDRNDETDLGGYKVYYSERGFSGPPYNGTSWVEGPSPITYPVADAHDPGSGVTTVVPYFFTLLAPPAGDSVQYYVAVTAYDTEGLESAFSNELDEVVAPDWWENGKPPAIPSGGPIVIKGTVTFEIKIGN